MFLFFLFTFFTFLLALVVLFAVIDQEREEVGWGTVWVVYAPDGELTEVFDSSAARIRGVLGCDKEGGVNKRGIMGAVGWSF